MISGDFLGTVSFNGDDGTSFVTAASIVATVDGTPGTNDMPGRLVFSTTADGASSPTERMRIDSAGNIGINTAAPAGQALRMTKNISGNTSSYAVNIVPTFQSDVTNSGFVFQSAPSTQAAAFTMTTLRHYAAVQGTIGAGSTVTNQYGFEAQASLIGATNNYGFHSNIASGTGRWNFYAAGTADNYFAGNLILGSSTLTTPTGSAPSYLCRAWVNFNGTGTVAIRASGNVSSITDNGTGDYTVNFTTAMPDVNYSFALSGKYDETSGNNTAVIAARVAGSIATGSLRVVSFSCSTAAQIDFNTVTVQIFR